MIIVTLKVLFFLQRSFECSKYKCINSCVTFLFCFLHYHFVNVHMEKKFFKNNTYTILK